MLRLPFPAARKTFALAAVAALALVSVSVVVVAEPAGAAGVAKARLPAAASGRKGTAPTAAVASGKKGAAGVKHAAAVPVPGAGPGDVIVNPVDAQGHPQGEGFSYNARANGIPPMCDPGIPAGSATPYCASSDYRTLVTINRITFAGGGVSIVLTPNDPRNATVQFLQSDFVRPGTYQQFFTADSHGYLFYSPLTTGSADGRGEDVQTCTYNVACTVGFRLQDYWANAFIGTQFVTVLLHGSTTGGGGVFIPLNPSAQPPTPTKPTVDFTATALSTPLKFQFVADAQAQSGASIVGYAWDFGDGTTDTTTGATPAHTYSSPGKYHVVVTVTDSNGLKTTVGRDVVAKAQYVVNSVADTANKADSGQRCDTGQTVGTPAVPECTLRAAIQAANASGAAQEVVFAVPGVTGAPTISPATGLPRATVPISIDGTSQPGGWVRLVGPSSFSGLTLGASDSVIKGFVFAGFDYAVKVGSNTGTKSNDTVTGNRFGTDIAGTTVTTQPATAILAAHASNLTISNNVMSTSGFGIQEILESSGTIKGNRVGVNAGGTTALAPAPEIGVLLRGGGPFTVADNTLATRAVGILLRGGGSSGSSISGNHLGVNTTGSARIASTGSGVFVDGVPGVSIADNVVAEGAAANGVLTADVVATGVQQCSSGSSSGCQGPFVARSGAVTGGHVTIRGNRVGILANGRAADAGARWGILAYGQLPNAIIESNVVGGHFDPSSPAGEISLMGTVDAIVSTNTIGTNAAGTVALASRIGVDLEGAVGTTVQDSLISGNDTAGIRVGEYLLSGAAKPVQSSKTTIKNNIIGVNRAGTAAVSNLVGVLVTDESTGTEIGVGNVISGNERAGVLIEGRSGETALGGDVIGANRAGTKAIGNRVGVEIGGQAAGVSISGCLIAGNSGAGVATTSPKVVHLIDSAVGWHRGGTVLGNAVGVDAQGPMDLLGDRIQANIGPGLTSPPTTQVAVFSDTTFSDNGTVGIVAPGQPAAPTLEAVLTKTRSGKTKLQLVVTSPGDPHALLGIAIYANPDCSQPGQARTTVKLAKAKYISADAYVLSPASSAVAGGYTATVTDYGDLSGGISTAAGRTSAISTCVVPHAYPDTSGTGIPDVIQKALGGDPSKPNTVSFVGADGWAVSLTASAGRFTDVTPADDLPALPAGVSLPSGPFGFKVTGLTPGGSVLVRVTQLSSLTSATSAYWRYGPPTVGGVPQWYRWEYDSATGTGAQPSGRAWILGFIDGYNGDDDGTANGTVVDPGGPAVDAAAPAVASAGAALAATGAPTRQPLFVALMTLVVGAGLCLAARRRPARRR